MKITAYSANAYEIPFLNAAFTSSHELTLIEEPLTANSINQLKDSDAVMLFTSDNASAPILKKIAEKGVKFIALRSVGYDHIDLETAAVLNMRVANVPSYSPHAVAEHAVLLLMALNRKLVQGQTLMKQNDFRLNELTGFDVHGKTVGIVGLGKIGQVFSKIMNGFGCRLICYDPSPNPELEKELNLKFVNFSQLCAESDVISIHCPLNKDSTYLFNANVFKQLKRNVYLINTSRGGVIKTDDLLDALENNMIGGVGMDVYEFEKGLFFQDHRNDTLKDTLFEKIRIRKNVLITGHQAFLTETALRNIAETSLFNIDCFEKGMNNPNELHWKDA